MKCEVKGDWSEYSVDVKRVRLMEGGGGTAVNAENDKKIKYFQTQFQDNEISGISIFQIHLIVVHVYIHLIHIYDDKMILKATVHVPGMNRPSGLCLLHVDGDTHFLLLTSDGLKCMLWVNEEARASEI